MERIPVTGGAGLIGRAVVEELADRRSSTLCAMGRLRYRITIESVLGLMGDEYSRSLVLRGSTDMRPHMAGTRDQLLIKHQEKRRQACCQLPALTTF